MFHLTIRKLWEEFINEPKYKKYFISDEDEWKLNLEWIKKYMNNKNKKPSTNSENTEIRKYGYWIQNQKFNYKNIKHIMKNDNVKKIWKDFINDPKYKKYFN